jgi:phage tail-like protein
MSDETHLSSYLEYLPAIFRQHPFLGRFLLAFEYMLTTPQPTSGLTAEGQPVTAMPIELVIGSIDRYFRPYDPTGQYQTPDAFLPWLAGWVALSLREDWDTTTRRKFLQDIVPLYQKRGTKAALQQMLEIYLGADTPVTIYETPTDFGFEPPAHFFQVAVMLSQYDPNTVGRIQQVSIAIIEREKPAHTGYTLRLMFPTIRLLSEQLQAKEGGERLVLGQNSLLGTRNIS